MNSERKWWQKCLPKVHHHQFDDDTQHGIEEAVQKRVAELNEFWEKRWQELKVWQGAMEKRIDAVENNHQVMRSHSAQEVSQIRTDLTNMSRSIQDNVFIEVQATSQHENQETQTATI